MILNNDRIVQIIEEFKASYGVHSDTLDNVIVEWQQYFYPLPNTATERDRTHYINAGVMLEFTSFMSLLEQLHKTGEEENIILTGKIPRQLAMSANLLTICLVRCCSLGHSSPFSHERFKKYLDLCMAFQGKFDVHPENALVLFSSKFIIDFLEAFQNYHHTHPFSSLVKPIAHGIATTGAGGGAGLRKTLFKAMGMFFAVSMRLYNDRHYWQVYEAMEEYINIINAESEQFEQLRKLLSGSNEKQDVLFVSSTWYAVNEIFYWCLNYKQTSFKKNEHLLMVLAILAWMLPEDTQKRFNVSTTLLSGMSSLLKAEIVEFDQYMRKIFLEQLNGHKLFLFFEKRQNTLWSQLSSIEPDENLNITEAEIDALEEEKRALKNELDRLNSNTCASSPYWHDSFRGRYDGQRIRFTFGGKVLENGDFLHRCVEKIPECLESCFENRQLWMLESMVATKEVPPPILGVELIRKPSKPQPSESMSAIINAFEELSTQRNSKNQGKFTHIFLHSNSECLYAENESFIEGAQYKLLAETDLTEPVLQLQYSSFSVEYTPAFLAWEEEEVSISVYVPICHMQESVEEREQLNNRIEKINERLQMLYRKQEYQKIALGLKKYCEEQGVPFSEAFAFLQKIIHDITKPKAFDLTDKRILAGQVNTSRAAAQDEQTRSTAYSLAYLTISFSQEDNMQKRESNAKLAQSAWAQSAALSTSAQALRKKGWFSLPVVSESRLIADEPSKVPSLKPTSGAEEND